MSRETVAAKAIRYLSEGRVRVIRVEVDQVDGTATSDSGQTYSTCHRPGEGWRCTCPSRLPCAHVAAMELICNTLAAPAPPRTRATPGKPAATR